MKTACLIATIFLAAVHTGLARAAECSAGTKHTSVASAPADPAATTYDIVDVALDAGSFKTLVTAVAAAGLVEPLRSDGPFTVFAPTDEAFAKLPAGTVESLLKPENRDKLTAILKYHVVKGRVDSTAAVKAGKAPTLAGKQVTIEATKSGVSINNAKVVKADVPARNGIIHVIDTVLLPPTNEPVTVATARRVIELAISRGVPLYNRGEEEACAAIYEVAASSLMTLGRDLLTEQARADLAQAIEQAEATADASKSAWILRRALDRTYGRTSAAPAKPVAFRPIIESRLPSGFPEPGPVGEIVVKDYPAYRAATVAQGRRGAFMKLFRHIKRNDIAMTAPVEMGVTGESGSTGSMAFLYGKPTIGQTGTDGDVVVKDRPAMTVLSIGLRGNSSNAATRDAVAQLQQWLGSQQTYVATAPPRLMTYNSPMIPSHMRYWEVQIPVTRAGAKA